MSLLALAAPDAAAQRYGQWWWESSLGLTRRQYRNLLDRVSLGKLDERELALGLRVNGFILHPALARFNVSADVTLSRFEGRERLDTRRLGAGALLSVLPQGAYPLSLYGGRQAYDYSKLAEDDPLNLLGLPDTSWNVGGRLRLRQGPLRGTRFAYDRTSLSFVGNETFSGSLREDALVEWDRGGRRFERRAHLDRRRQDYGIVDFSQRDWTGTYDQRGMLNPGWRWELQTTGLRREASFGGVSSAIDSLRTSQRFLQAGERRDVLDLTYDGGFIRGAGNTAHSHLVQGRYRLRPAPEWVITPFAGYGVQSSDGHLTQAPSAGASATWTRRRGGFDLSLSGAASLLLLRGGGANDSALGLDLGASLGHGADTGLRKEFELSWTRNRLRRAGESFTELPDLGASLGATGTEDLLVGRLTLQRRFRRYSFYNLGEGTRRTLRTRPGVPAGHVQNLTETLQVSSQRLTLTGNLAAARVGGSGETQRINSWYAALSWHPLRLVTLTGSYRADRRTLTLAPDLHGRRYEARADVHVGAFVLRGQVFGTRERSGEIERVNRGLILSLARQFAGWLPIVTGPPEGGEIR